MSEDQWREKLTAEEYRVCRENGTEHPFTGEYCDNKRAGKYLCKCCGEELFSSETKFDSGSGWPSFDRPGNEEAIRYLRDSTPGYGPCRNYVRQMRMPSWARFRRWAARNYWKALLC